MLRTTSKAISATADAGVRRCKTEAICVDIAIEQMNATQTSPPSAITMALEPLPSSSVASTAVDRFCSHANLIAELNDMGTFCLESGATSSAASIIADAWRATKRARTSLVQSKADESLSETQETIDKARQKFLPSTTYTHSSNSITRSKDSSLSLYSKPVSMEYVLVRLRSAKENNHATNNTKSLDKLLSTSMPRLLAVILFNLGLCHHLKYVQCNAETSRVKAFKSYQLALQQLCEEDEEFVLYKNMNGGGDGGSVQEARDDCHNADSSSSKSAAIIDDQGVHYLAILNNMGCLVDAGSSHSNVKNHHKVKKDDCREYFQMISRILSHLDNETTERSPALSVFKLNCLLWSKAPSPAA